MKQVHIALTGPFAERTLRAYRSGEAFTVAGGVAARRAKGGRDPQEVVFNDQRVWRLDIEVISGDWGVRQEQVDHPQFYAVPPSILLH